MSALSNTQYTIRNMRWARYCALCIVYCALSACGPTVVDEEEFSMTTVPRLAKYYPEVNTNGDTTYKTVPPGTFTDQNGNYFSTSQFQGGVQVVHFFFASCQGICPVIANSMQQVQAEFAGNPDVKMLSFTVDPDRDSAGALKEYADRYKVDSTQWRLLTGEKKLIYDHIRYDYLLPEIEPGTGGDEDFIHSEQLVLVDRNSIIRGYYAGTDTAQVRMLIEDIHILLQEK